MKDSHEGASLSQRPREVHGLVADALRLPIEAVSRRTEAHHDNRRGDPERNAWADKEDRESDEYMAPIEAKFKEKLSKEARPLSGALEGALAFFVGFVGGSLLSAIGVGVLSTPLLLGTVSFGFSRALLGSRHDFWAKYITYGSAVLFTVAALGAIATSIPLAIGTALTAVSLVAGRFVARQLPDTFIHNEVMESETLQDRVAKKYFPHITRP